MAKDRVSHTEVLRRAANTSDENFRDIQRCAHAYLQALAGIITEANPVRDVRVNNLGMLRIKKHKAHVGQDINAGEQVTVPAHRSINLEAAPRIKEVMKAPIDKFYDQDEFG